MVVSRDMRVSRGILGGVFGLVVLLVLIARIVLLGCLALLVLLVLLVILCLLGRLVDLLVVFTVLAFRIILRCFGWFSLRGFLFRVGLTLIRKLGLVGPSCI